MDADFTVGKSGRGNFYKMYGIHAAKIAQSFKAAKFTVAKESGSFF
ncbi:hypothetical protein [Flavobacterium akiainvivens]|nr:hypothetical protein [Flavobacterium akiainvivens]SFQ65191.1 hypothetical protein SAMN05444144_11243 [Flavobacterium akiainvivens]